MISVKYYLIKVVLWTLRFSGVVMEAIVAGVGSVTDPQGVAVGVTVTGAGAGMETVGETVTGMGETVAAEDKRKKKSPKNSLTQKWTITWINERFHKIIKIDLLNFDSGNINLRQMHFKTNIIRQFFKTIFSDFVHMYFALYIELRVR